MNEALLTHTARLGVITHKFLDNRATWCTTVSHSAEGLPVEIFQIDMKLMPLMEELVECLVDLGSDIN